MQDQDRVKTKRSKTENWNWAHTAGTEAQMALGKDSPQATTSRRFKRIHKAELAAEHSLHVHSPSPSLSQSLSRAGWAVLFFNYTDVKKYLLKNSRNTDSILFYLFCF